MSRFEKSIMVDPPWKGDLRFSPPVPSEANDRLRRAVNLIPSFHVDIVHGSWQPAPWEALYDVSFRNDSPRFSQVFGSRLGQPGNRPPGTFRTQVKPEKAD